MAFDTVFSSRTVQENYDPVGERPLPPPHPPGTHLRPGVPALHQPFVPVRQTRRHLCHRRADGTGSGFSGLLPGAAQQGLDLIPESHQELHCQEGDHTTTLQAFCGVKEGRTTPTDAEDFFIATFQDALTWQPRPLGRGRRAVLELCAQKLTVATSSNNPQGARVGKLAIYTSKFDPEELFYYQGILGQPVQVHRLSRGELSDVLALLETDLATLTASTLSAHPFSFQDGVELLLPLEESEEN